MATAPSFGAGIVDNAPIKLPIGVLAADTMTTSLFILNRLKFTCAKLIIFLQNLTTKRFITNQKLYI